MYKLTIIAFLFYSCTLIGQDKNTNKQGAFHSKDWSKSWSEYHPKKTDYPSHDEIIIKNITVNTTLKSDETYHLEGNILVTDNAILTIEAGTIIRCSSNKPTTLTITAGAKIYAEGNRVAPIIFTSDKAPSARNEKDWGGIHILGNSTINSLSGIDNAFKTNNPKTVFGGNNKNDNSGILKYVRIEFAGADDSNGLSLHGVGSETSLEKIQVSYSGDDGFEFYGGTVSAKHLISFHSSDDDFDATMGYNGTLTEILAIRHPYISHKSGSKSIEIDGYSSKSYNTNLTKSHMIVKNATFACTSDKNNAQFTFEAISLANDAKLTIENSIITGYKNAANINNVFKPNIKSDQNLTIKNSTIQVYETPVFGVDIIDPNLISGWYSLDKFKNKINNSTNLLPLFIDAKGKNHRDYRLSNPTNIASGE